MRALDLMSSPVVTVHPETAVQDAAALLERHGFGALPVVDDEDALIGITTEADLLRNRITPTPRSRFWHRVPAQRPAPGGRVGDVMSTSVVAMSPQTDAAHLADIMLREHVRTIPIVRGTEVIGIVTRRDLLRTLVRTDDSIAAEVGERLEVYSGPDRWTVSVCEGTVELTDNFSDETDHEVAVGLVEAVPGVARATVHCHRDVAGP